MIRQGDTLSALARKYGTSVSRICSLNNNLTPNTVLQLGRKVRVR
ncbi:MAG: LysM peptidoglycan-binding domain-containing protein [Bacteroidales bacterium]|nr:LysM peptidoglycan-binding domain-containing protein [Bacteroidales bacterium]